MSAKIVLTLVLAMTINLPGRDAKGETRMFEVPEDIVDGVPEHFPRFHFSGHERKAQLLSRYNWHHFVTRPGIGKTLFNKEYLTTGDLWAADALLRGNRVAQGVYREVLLGIRLDDEGYVYTHQHFSHCHEHGWPFPLWTQVPEGYEGRTFGWHFQEDGPKWQWLWGMLAGWANERNHSETATRGWELDNVESLGVSEDKWRLRSTGDSPKLTTPEGIVIDAAHAPFLQLRWTRTGEAPVGRTPYIEWLCEGDEEFGEDRRVNFSIGDPEEFEHVTKSRHTMITLFRHPKWRGKIHRMRLSLAPGESDVEFGIDSLFTVYDSRHTINNPIFILASWNYFRWTGDVDFLRKNINRMRTALRYQQTEMGGLEHNHIRNTWWGHDGLGAFVLNEDGSKTFRSGHGIGSNYWDILPFGWDDLYATNQYYASTLAMAEMEDLIAGNSGWNVPRGAMAFDPEELRAHAARVRMTANRKFWNNTAGRFVACIDIKGASHDYGFSFLNLDAIWYGLATDEHAMQILDWLTGKRIVEGDTSQGEDIYHWRFGPRATTKRNIEWYMHGWTAPESIEWGGQVQDGGAVLGFSFYDLWARLKYLGPDNAWARLTEILEWEEKVWKEGGYRAYYADGKRGTTLQGGGTAGGLGIDHEFYESILIPSIVTYGFLGLEPKGDALSIEPSLPEACPEMGIQGLLYRGVRMNVLAGKDRISIDLQERPMDSLHILLGPEWRMEERKEEGPRFSIQEPGVYTWVR